MNQEAVRNALLKLKKVINSFRSQGEWETNQNNLIIILQDQWRGIDQCPWPNCEDRADQNFWSVSDGVTEIIIPEMLLHYAEAGHWISYTDMSSEKQQLLIELLMNM